MIPLDTPAPFSALDRSLAAFLDARQPSEEPRHAWLAALVSHQFGRGHACLDLEALAEQPVRLLAWKPEQAAALPAGLSPAARSLPWCEGADSPLVLDPTGTRLYLRRAWQAEQRVLAQIALRQQHRPPALPDLESQLDTLFPAPPPDGRPDAQRRACAVAARMALAVITGGPGTGKTTTVTRLLRLLLNDARARGQALRVHLAAPTGKAASRLSQSIGKQLQALPADEAAGVPHQATTLHRLLGLRDSPGRQAGAALATDLVIVDEASMIDLEMMASLLEAVPITARLVLLGDKDQLASVEAGAVLAQLCERPDLQDCIVRLHYSHRFAGGSAIGRWAAALNAGDAAAVGALWQDLPPWQPHLEAPLRKLRADPVAVSLATALRQGWQAWQSGLASLHAAGAHCDDATARQLLDDFAQFQVLCALRSGPWGTEAVNLHAARALGFGREPWYAGRPVMVTHNDYALKLMNGDVGLCLPREGGLRVVFRDADGSLRWVLPSRLEHVETVFAMTVHKAQGSEFQHVLLVLPDRDSPVLTRELLYTGLTRAREGVTWLVPDAAVLLRAVAQRVLRAGGLSA